MSAALKEAVEKTFLPNPPAKIGVAVSGGGDSMALLVLLRDFCRERDLLLEAVTVDHGLRPASAQEAELVADQCAAWGLRHEVLRISALPQGGNLQGLARDARYEALATWAARREISTIALGHTADDQAETFLMRLARRSGVDGLSSMSPHRLRQGIVWMRPLLGVTRSDLRDFLRQEGVSWSEDPSNEDITFERVRIREALTLLEPLGIGTGALVEVATNLRQVRFALEWQAFQAAQEIAAIEAGAVTLQVDAFGRLPEEIKRRLLVHALGWLTGAHYGPRRATMAGLLASIAAGRSCTAEGCHILTRKGTIWIFRELKALAGYRVAAGETWDGRWRLFPQKGHTPRDDLHIAALGDAGLAACPDWRDAGLPRPLLLSSPALWQGDALVAAPLARREENWHAELTRGEDAFFTTFLTH